MKYIQDQLKQEDNLSANQSEEAIWLLWQRNQELTKCLKQWEILLGDLGVDYNNITEGLQVYHLKLLIKTFIFEGLYCQRAFDGSLYPYQFC